MGISSRKVLAEARLTLSLFCSFSACLPLAQPLFITSGKNEYETGEFMRLKQKVSSVITFALLAALCAIAQFWHRKGRRWVFLLTLRFAG
jgi:hypothetical protein